jgi:epoxyqueuosine reductase
MHPAEAGNLEIVSKEAQRLGAAVIGFAPVRRRAEHGGVSPEYHPDAIWVPTQTVIVLGVPLMLPVVESKLKQNPTSAA